MVSILLILLLLFCVVLFGGIFIFSNHRLYCYIFENEKYKLWEYYINNVDAIIPDPKYKQYNAIKNFITHDNKQLTYWGDEDNVSIHENDNTCILSSFDKYHNKLMVKTLKERGLI